MFAIIALILFFVGLIFIFVINKNTSHAIN